MKNAIYFVIVLIISIIALLIFKNINLSSKANYITIMNTNYILVRDIAPPIYFIENCSEKIEALKKIFKEKPITARLKYKASLISHLGEEEIIINGIIPKNDKEVFNIINNETMEKIKDKNFIIINSKTALALDINIGDNIILKLITKDGYYNAEEFIILDIAKNLDYNFALIDINKLNNLVNLNNLASEIYIKDTKFKESYNDIITKIFGEDLKIYSMSDFKQKIKTKEKINIIKISKKNISENTFLFEGGIKNIDEIINEIKLLDKESEIKNVINFPVGIVTKTGSAQSRVYNTLQDLSDISNFIIEGKIYENNKNQIIVGKDLANYLKLKIGDAVSLIARGSRGWLETTYFTISGIYEFKNKNFDIYADTKTISNFIYLKSGNKSPYNESLLIFSEKSIYSDLMKNEILKDMDIIKFDKTE
jgi:ABC-type lipoprotein release transport system permease subunit